MKFTVGQRPKRLMSMEFYARDFEEGKAVAEERLFLSPLFLFSPRKGANEGTVFDSCSLIVLLSFFPLRFFLSIRKGQQKTLQ